MTEDANASYSYAACQGKHAGVVQVYEKMRQSILDYIEQSKR